MPKNCISISISIIYYLYYQELWLNPCSFNSTTGIWDLSQPESVQWSQVSVRHCRDHVCWWQPRDLLHSGESIIYHLFWCALIGLLFTYLISFPASWTQGCCQTVCLRSPGWPASSPTSPPCSSTCTCHWTACVKPGRKSSCRWTFDSQSLFRLVHVSFAKLKNGHKYLTTLFF